MSVIVPVYNVEKYLPECLESLLNQDLSKENYEIICVNDGSTDGSGTILDDYAAKNDNITVIHKENGGVSSARNRGLEVAIGEYVWFIDADDWIRENCLRKLAGLISKYSPNLLNVAYQRIFTKPVAAAVNDAMKYKIRRTICNTGSVCVSIIKLELIKKYGISFNENLKYGEDSLFQICLFLHMSKGVCLQINDFLYFYRQHNDSAVHRAEELSLSTKWALDLLERMRLFRLYKTEKKFKDKERFLNAMQYNCCFSFLVKFPHTTLDYKETMKTLKKEKFYPFPLRWSKCIMVKGVKNKIMNLYRVIFFRFEFLYKSYYNREKQKRAAEKE